MLAWIHFGKGHAIVTMLISNISQAVFASEFGFILLFIGLEMTEVVYLSMRVNNKIEFCSEQKHQHSRHMKHAFVFRNQVPKTTYLSVITEIDVVPGNRFKPTTSSYI